MKPKQVRTNSLWTTIALRGGAAGLALLSAVAVARADSNPYAEVIVTRNAFGLKDPPAPPPPPDNTPPPPKLTLVGIANVFGVKKAVIKTQPAPGAAPKPATPGGPPPGQEPPLTIDEGKMLGGIDVKSIDDVAGVVKVVNGGQEYTLTFEKDGIKAPIGPAAGTPGAPGGVPGMPNPTGMPRPGGLPGVAGGVGGTPFPTGANPMAGTLSGVPTALPGTVAAGTPLGTPQRQVRTPTYEEQVVMLEANRILNQEKVNKGLLPPLPPTPLTPPEIRSRIESAYPPGYTPPTATK